MRPSLILFCCALVTASQARDWRSFEGVELQGVVMPLYGKPDLSLLANVRIGRAFPDHERKGFFRIGLLPLLAGENVQIEVLQPRRALKALNKLQHRFTSKQRQHVEWRNVEFLFPPETAPRMRVGRIRMMNEDRWELLDGVRIRTSEGEEVSWSKAVLHWTGPSAGQVIPNSGSGDAAVNLFMPAIKSDSTNPK